jgi:hypothetical protein
MPDASTIIAGERLRGAVGDAFPPRHSKLPRHAWEQASRLYAAHNGRVTLRTLCTVCDVSHRTAWRMREVLRDREQVLREARRDRPAMHASSAPVPIQQGDAR